MYLPILRVHLLKKRSVKDSSNDAYGIFLCSFFFFFFFFFYPNFLYKSICYGYSFELHQQFDVIQLDTHNMCYFIKKK